VPLDQLRAIEPDQYMGQPSNECRSVDDCTAVDVDDEEVVREDGLELRNPAAVASHW